MSTRRFGFTLVELLIVAVVLSIFAGIVYTQMSGTTQQAKEASLASFLSRVRGALDRYRVDHGGDYPGRRAAITAPGCTSAPLTPAAAGTPAAVRLQLRYFTDAQGRYCTERVATTPYGPYLDWNSDTANAVTGSAELITITAGWLTFRADGRGGGFKLDTISGRFIANDTSLDSKGVPYDSY